MTQPIENIRILMLEDVPSDAELEEIELQDAGLAFTSLRVDTREAFEQALDEFMPDIILADYRLPAYNGRDALEYTCRTHPQIPVIMVTGALGDEAAVELLKMGARDYVLKGSLARLAPAIKRALSEEISIRNRKLAEDKYLAVFNEAMDGIVLVGCETWQVVDCNPEFEKQSGRTLAQLKEIKVWEILPPEQHELCRQTLFEIQKTGSGRDSNFTMQKPGGEIVPVEFSAKFLDIQQQSFIQSTTHDISERLRAEHALHDSEEKFRSITASAQDAILMMDNEEKISYWNAAAEKIFGYPAQEALGQTLHELLTPARFHEDFHKGFSHFRETGEGPIVGKTVEVTGLRKDRTEFSIGLSLSAIKRGGRWHAIGIVRDITERKQAEYALRRANRALKTLSAGNLALVRATSENELLQEVTKVVVEKGDYLFAVVDYAEDYLEKIITPMAWFGTEESRYWAESLSWADTEYGQLPVAKAIRSGATQICHDIASSPAFKPWRDAVLTRGYVSNIALPLSGGGRTFGGLSIYASEAEAFDEEEVLLLEELADDMAFGIMTLRTRKEHARAEKEIRTLNAELEQRVLVRTAELQAANHAKDELILRERAAAAELKAAHQREVEIGYKIQQMLLLDQPPIDVQGLQVAALTIPSQQIDGDFYDFYKHENQCLDLIVADVMGKGILAALLGAATKSHFLEALCHLMALSKEGALPEPKEIVTLAHAEMVQHLINLESFVTLCYVRFDLNENRLDMVDCGHTGLIHWQAGTGLCRILHGDNLPLGIREGEIYDQVSVAFEPGDLLLLYSDGVTEARDSAGELFGEERLTQCVRANSELEPEQLVQAIRKAAFTFSQSDRLADDLTCVAIKVVERQFPLGRAEMEIRSDLGELARAREFVRSVCRDLAGPLLDEDSVSKLELAVTETCSNIMKHAYHGRADQWIHLEAKAFPGNLSIRLHHLGDPLDPAKVPPPVLDGSQESGFGIYLIARSVDEARYYRDERGRNCIVLVMLRQQ